MAGPLSGIGSGVQVPLSTTSLKSSVADDRNVSVQNESSQVNENTNTQSAPVSAPVESNTAGLQQDLSSGVETLAQNDNGKQNRGSVVDIQV